MTLLSDPTPAGAASGQWWPPQILDAGWIRDHVAEFDVLHLHFGAEWYTPEHVLAAFAEARRAGKPVVYTVHDLENPQLADQDAHQRMLDAIVPAADTLITLTAAGREEIAARWGRSSLLLPHPTLIAEHAGARLPVGSAHPEVRIGVHLRDLRPNIDAVGVVTTLIRAVAQLRSVGARVHGSIRLNENVRDDDAAALIAHLVADAEGVELIRAPRLSDDELAESIADLDVCILPYSHGTHSGWLELCYDLAVPVIGPWHGHFREQHPDDYSRYEVGEPLSLAAAIERATSPAWSRPGSPARAAEVAARAAARAVERQEIRDAHAQLYRSLTTRRSAA